MKQKVKVVILGLTGSGKTTVAGALRDNGLPVLEVDDEVIKRNKGKWPRNEKVIDRLFAEVNDEVVMLKNVVFVTSFLDEKDIEKFYASGFKIIEMHAGYDELVKRKKKRDKISEEKLLRFKKNYNYYKKVIEKKKQLISLSIDTTKIQIREMVKKVEKELVS